MLVCDILFFGSEESAGWLPKEAVLGIDALGIEPFLSCLSLSFFLFSVNIPDISSSTQGRESLSFKVSWDLAFCLLAGWLNTGHFSVSWLIYMEKKSRAMGNCSRERYIGLALFSGSPLKLDLGKLRSSFSSPYSILLFPYLLLLFISMHLLFSITPTDVHLIRIMN